MADVQVEHGFTRIADALLEALMRAEMPSLHLRVVLAVVRLTYGFQKREDAISAKRLHGLIGGDFRAIQRALSDLGEWGVLGSRMVPGQPAVRWIRKDFELWRIGESTDAARRREYRKAHKDTGAAPGTGGAPGTGALPQPGTGATAQGVRVTPPQPGTGATGAHKREITENSTENSTDSAGARDPSPTERARAVWPRLREAAARYGVTWARAPGRAQLATLTARIRDDGLGERELELVVHGYIALRGTECRGDFNPLAHLTPKTLYRPSNWPEYLAAGESPPPRNAGDRHAARHDRRSLTGAVQRILERDERRAAGAGRAPGQALRVVPGDPGT